MRIINTFADLDLLRSIVSDASNAVMEIYNQGFSVIQKDDNSPLTQADNASHEIIKTSLEKISDFPIFSEEGNYISWSERKHWSRYWLIDPLDGTKEFIKKNDEFTINISLIENGVPIVGVVAAPAMQIKYFGVQGLGAWEEDNQGRNKKIKVSTPPASSWKVVGSRSHLSNEVDLLINALPKAEIVLMGSSLKLCAVAAGIADLYPRFGPTSEWDTAAAQAVVEAAGGQVLNMDLCPLRYNTKESVLNPHFIVCAQPNKAWTEFIKKNRNIM